MGMQNLSKKIASQDRPSLFFFFFFFCCCCWIDDHLWQPICCYKNRDLIINQESEIVWSRHPLPHHRQPQMGRGTKKQKQVPTGSSRSWSSTKRVRRHVGWISRWPGKCLRLCEWGRPSRRMWRYVHQWWAWSLILWSAWRFLSLTKPLWWKRRRRRRRRRRRTQWWWWWWWWWRWHDVQWKCKRCSCGPSNPCCCCCHRLSIKEKMD